MYNLNTMKVNDNVVSGQNVDGQNVSGQNVSNFDNIGQNVPGWKT